MTPPAVAHHVPLLTRLASSADHWIPTTTMVKASLKSDDVIFLGSYDLCDDELVSDKQRVQMTAHEVWKAGGYRFRVHKNKVLASGVKCRMWCCQDKGRKQKEHRSTKPNAKPRENVGMMRYPSNPHGGKTIRVYLRHAKAHRHYYDVQMPEGALAIIRDRLETATPNELVGQIQTQFPNVTAAQIHTTWSKMSETVWKRDPNQLLSAQTLLREFPEDVDLFEEVVPTEGIEQLCFGLKRVLEGLRGKLYSIMGEHDNAGFPLTYCLLTTAQAVGIGKRKRALEAWAKVLRDKYGINPKFVHLDKDMAEIGMAQDVWKAKIQLCWWHMREALKRRLALAKLSTTPYNPTRANQCFPFIDPQFKPPGHPDKNKHEGGQLPEDTGTAQPILHERPWALSIRIPRPTLTVEPTLTIRIPGRAEEEDKDDDDSGEDEEDTKRTFCALEHRTKILTLVEKVYCAHPLIPGYAASNPKAIHEWGTKILYNFCVSEDLREVWAYLWENWLRPGRWELWARSANAEIPVLKTTMILESHWRRIKKDFLHHFASPRVDLLVWILVTKLAPTYYRKLDLILHPISRYRELASWRKAFKREWRCCETVAIELPINEQYQPNPHLWTFRRVTPLFFLEVKRSRTTPFWRHKDLVPLSPADGEGAVVTAENCDVPIDERVGDEDEDSDDEADFQATQKTFLESMQDRISTLKSFADGLEYQLQFNDNRMLTTLEREGAALFRLAGNCLDREKRFNSSRHLAPATYERATSNAMFWRPRPRENRDVA
ncbi:hypothetical protein C8J56DRAFT_1007246 [Mycena floridula]|nr:hypothetical protein C8J56DRAFT_1007246 [Mycena floridula]